MSTKEIFWRPVLTPVRYIIHYDLPKSFEGQSIKLREFPLDRFHLQDTTKKLVAQVVMVKCEY